MNDSTEDARREMITSGQPAADLAGDLGPQWTTEQLQQEFEVLGFLAPMVVVRRRSDGATGSLEFTGRPRVYFAWRPDQPAPDTADHTRSDALFFEPE
jgi:hypothetical protein